MNGRGMALLVVLVMAAGCAQRPYIGIEISNSPHPADCIPGSVTRPCP
jgi:hypothetical protein